MRQSTRARGLDVVWLRTQAPSIILLTTFILVSVTRTLGAASVQTVVVDARIYRFAAQAMLNSGDPWSASVSGFSFAGTPPSLLAFIPAALLPEAVAVPLYLAIFAAIGVLVLRRLELPLWWLLFPPLWESILVVNQDVVVLWLLLMSGAAAGLAVVCKTYAAIPLALQGRWRPLAIGVAVSLLTLPLWVQFIERRDTITAALTNQASGGLSAWDTWLMVPTAIALIGLRGRGASWLIIPALWPATQLHYSLLALPVARRSPMLAFLLCFANPLVPAIAVILECLRQRVVVPWWTRRNDERQAARPGATYTDPSASP